MRSSSMPGSTRRPRKGSLEDAVFMTVTRTGPAVMYAMLATCMGFLAMFVSISR